MRLHKVVLGFSRGLSFARLYRVLLQRCARSYLVLGLAIVIGLLRGSSGPLRGLGFRV